MPWGYLQLEVVPADLLVRPVVGPGGLTREGALAEVQSILDQASLLNSAMVVTAGLWRRGAKDDTVYFSRFAWAVFEHDGEDPMPAARAWLEDYVEILRSAGLDVGIGWPAG